MSAPGSTPEDTEPRRIAGRYRLTEPLGAGAMGTVWSGYDEVLHRAVAIKELRVPPGVPRGEMVAMRERMMREARTLGGLSHPNVITLYDVVDVEGDPFVVMELLPSRNLSEVIGEQGRLSISQAASIGLATAAALQAAHRAGITHRDVKPGNVLVAHDGRIKLTDFGIARKRDDVTMTATGLVLGSPAYIAPEVAAGQPVTPAADLWGLGATLFAAIEARPPYDVDGDPVKTITAVVHDDVPKPRIDGPLADVISALMVKDPDKRMDLAEVRRKLRPLLADPDDPLFPGSVDAFSPPPEPTGGTIGEDNSGGSAGSVTTPAASSPNGGPSSASAPSSPTHTSSGMSTVPRSGGTGTWNVRTGANPLAADPGPLPAPLANHPTGHQPSQQTGHPTPHPRPFSDSRTGAPPASGTGAPMRPARPSWQPPTTGVPPRPPMPRPVPPAPRPTAQLQPKWALPLALAGALAVLFGAGLGYVSTRVLVNQAPFSTSVASPLTGVNVQLKQHSDAPQRYGPGALGFTAAVPTGWEEYRLADDDSVSVRFISPDGARELRIDKITGTRANPAQPGEFVANLTPSALGVADVAVLSQNGNEVSYRTTVTGPQGVLNRVSYAQLTQAGNDLWVLRLTVPADHAGESTQTLFTALAQRFRP